MYVPYMYVLLYVYTFVFVCVFSHIIQNICIQNFNNFVSIFLIKKDGILKMKIKDKFDQVYTLVLTLDSLIAGGVENTLIKPIVYEQRLWLSKFRYMQQQIDKHYLHIERLIELLLHIKQSKKILAWGAIPKVSHNTKPMFDLVVSELRNVTFTPSPISTNTDHFVYNRKILSIAENDGVHIASKVRIGDDHKNDNYYQLKRTQSNESLDSVYDLSIEDNLRKFKQSVQDVKLYVLFKAVERCLLE